MKGGREKDGERWGGSGVGMNRRIKKGGGREKRNEGEGIEGREKKNELMYIFTECLRATNLQ